MNRPEWRMYWKNGCKMTVKRMAEENRARAMDAEKIKKINSNLAQLAEIQEQNGICRETPELKDWQWEIMLRNESENEDWE